MEVLRADVAIIGGGLGACAAALAAARLGRRVILTEETQWIGGQLTNQAVPPDEHPWIEEFGATASYRALRRGIREYYRSHFPLTSASQANPRLNPGNGWVSRLCHDPRVAVAVLHQLMAPHQINGRLFVMHPCRPLRGWTHADRITGVEVRELTTGREWLIEAEYFIDATPYGDLLEFAGVEHVVGAESRAETEEPHAADQADPKDQQAITVCFAMEYLPGEDHTIEKPRQYDLWRDFHPPGWPGPLLGWTTVRPETGEALTRFLFEAEDNRPWWRFRRILDRTNFTEGFAPGDISVVNWPQNDYWFGPIVGVDGEEQARNTEAARGLSLSLLYWLQTEAPRPDGGTGYPGLRLRRDVVGATADGLAPAPYVRESRRIRSEFTVLEQHIAYPLRPGGPAIFTDSVGIGAYRIDLHPRVNGAGYLDMGCWPFQIPLGSMIPVRVENLLPGGKNLGDEAILEGILGQLRASVSAEITVLSRNPSDTLARHRVEHAIAPRSLTRREMTQELRRFDLLVLGGGGILYDRDAHEYMREVFLAHELNVPVFVYAISAGPLIHHAARQAVREGLNASPTTVITVRDRLGYRLLEDVGVSQDIHLTADPAFLLDGEELPADAWKADGLDFSKRLVAFSVREPGPAAPDIDPDEYYALLANAADFMVERYDADVVFVPLERTDVQHSHAVVAHMQRAEKAEIVRRQHTPRQLIGLMSHFEFAVGMRLHFCIFATLSGTPFTALPYASKVTGLLEDLEVEMPPLGSIGIGQLISSIDRSWDTRDRIRTAIESHRSKLKARAAQTNELLLKLLRRQSSPNVAEAIRPPD